MTRKALTTALALSMAADHAALQQRIEQHPNDYEKRDDGRQNDGESDMVAKLDAIGEAFEDYQRRMNARLDQMETRRHRPGQGEQTKEERTESIFTDVDRGNLTVLRASSDFERHYHQRSVGTGGSNRPGAGQVFSPGSFTMADFVRGALGMETSPEARAALAVGTNTAGGYAVPDILMPGILSAFTPASALMQAGAGIIDTRGEKSITNVAVDSIPTPAWRLEMGSVAESEPTFRAVVGAPKSLAFYVKCSREILADARNMEAALNAVIGQAMAKEFDRAGLRGSGTDPEPEGILNNAAVLTVTQGTNGAVVADYSPILSGMLAIRKQNAPMPTSWITSPDATFKYAGLADTTGQPLRAPEMVTRLRQYDTTQIPINLTVGSSSNCTEQYLGDFSGFYYLMRENVSIQVLRELFAADGAIGFLVHARLDTFIPYPKQFCVVKGTRV